MGKTWDAEEFKKTLRAAAAEGIVLLKNDDGALPLKKDAGIAVFGRCQMNYYRCGTGSGGMVNPDYVVSIYEALENSGKLTVNKTVRAAYERFVEENPYERGAGWASEPWFQKEMPLDDDLVKSAAQESDTAVFIIGRTAGEDQDNKNEEGSYLLTKEETAALAKVCAAFERTVVLLNVGNIIDMKWVKELNPSAVLYVWQGGQEGGNAVLDVLTGEVDPSGKLADTIAENISDYPSTSNFGSEKENLQTEDIYVGYRYFETFAPDRVLYPFGYGLSYTDFSIDVCSFERESEETHITVNVKNTGAVSGKEVVQVYLKAPQGLLGKPARVLCAFGKTPLLATGESQKLEFKIPDYMMSSYDDGGVTGHRSAYVCEPGEYDFFVGSDVRSAVKAGSFILDELKITAQCEEACAPVRGFMRLSPRYVNGAVEKSYDKVPVRTADPNKKRLDRLPKANACVGDKGYKLSDVEAGKISMEEFIEQLTDEDLCAISRGEGMSSPKVTAGIAGAFGGITDRLKDLGIPVAGCADGPSGIRMDCGTHAYSLPNGTCLACTFSEEINEKLFNWEGLDLRRHRIDALLGPGMNIHRNPLNGRNFEYFSEDPLLTGKLVAAQIRGLHKYGVFGVIKHFAGNTQEYKRRNVNNIMSERALREIYLKAFETAVKEGPAMTIMSSYGPVNGIYSASNYDLLTTILRKEWGFKGIVMTDWWAMGNDGEGAKASISNVASQARAQNDIFMVCSDAGSNSNNDNLNESLANGRLTRGELARNAANILGFIMRTQAYRRAQTGDSDLDKELLDAVSTEDSALHDMMKVAMGPDITELDAGSIKIGRGASTSFLLSAPHRCLPELELVIRAVDQPDVAQLPVSVFQNRELVKTVTLTGMDRDWQTVRITLGPVFVANFFLKLYFAQGGLEIRSAKLTIVRDLEEEFKKRIAQFT
jgi:beta-glucosidase